jgi:hypothetical protein
MSLEAANAAIEPTTVRPVEPASEPTDVVLERARRMGPLPYSARGRNAGPELPTGAALVDWLVGAVDDWWAELGCPDPFTLVEIGAGDGTRAAAGLARGPQCLSALRYVLVEEDRGGRQHHSLHLPIESPILVLGPVGPADRDDDEDEDEASRSVVGIGPLITSLREPPVVSGPAVVVAMGWASRLPSDRFEWRDRRWWEIRVAADVDADGGVDAAGGLLELAVPLDEQRSAVVEALVGPSARQDGSRYAQMRPAADWLARTLRIAECGQLAVIDRWTEVTSPVAEGTPPPLALDQLASVRKPLEARPVELFSGLSIVSWHLG